MSVALYVYNCTHDFNLIKCYTYDYNCIHDFILMMC